MSTFKIGLVASTMMASCVMLAAPGLALAATAPTAGNTVEEIVVTAQKTAQNVQNVPIAVTAVTAQMLQQKGITDVAKLSSIAPNVSLDAGKWHSLAISHKGETITCSLAGKKHLEVKDDTFAKAGKVGLWTKADAQTYFDDIQIKAK